MKNFISILYVILVLSSCVDSQEEVIIDNEITQPVIKEIYFNYTIGNGPFVYFEDVTFKKLLLSNLDVNLNKDNEISIEEALKFTEFIDVSFKNIYSIVGIEEFKNIRYFNCGNNGILNVDFRNNNKLISLQCGNNPFNSIDLINNVHLEGLDIRTTNIVFLDLSSNINLIRIRGMCNSSLRYVNLKNENNNKIKVCFFGLNNSVLECIQVDDVDYIATIYNWSKPIDCEYSINCTIDSI